MNSNMIAKWFYDNNFLVREGDLDLLNRLVFTACACLGIDEKVEFKDESPVLELKYGDYDFGSETINFLNCLNRAIGYNEYKNKTYMYNKVLKNLKKDFVNYEDISSYYKQFRKDILSDYEGYNFNKRVIKVGYNIYFLNFDDELSEDDLKLFEHDDLNQRVFEVFKNNGEYTFL